MKDNSSSSGTSIALGAAAGLAGTFAMMAMRSFDQKFATKTIGELKEDPGAFAVHQVERVTGRLPANAEHAGAAATHFGYGTLFGTLYGLWRGRGESRSSLVDGVGLGTIVYLLNHAGLLPLLKLEKPLWEQEPPAIAGELLRHVAYGVAVASTYDVADTIL